MAHTASNSAGTALFSGVGTYLRSIQLSVQDYAYRLRIYRNTYFQLDAMTDAELADIGITRFMIADVAADAAARA